MKRLFNRDALACQAELFTPSLGIGVSSCWGWNSPPEYSGQRHQRH
jgi:hypothetical protein